MSHAPRRNVGVKVRTSTVVLGISLLVGCGSTKPQAANSRPAMLRVKQVMVPGSLYTEGSFSYVRVERDGQEIAKVKLEDSRAELRLDEGSYRLISFQRPCDGNCGYLDPPMDQCDLPVDVAPDELVTATVRLSPGKGCTIALANGD